MAASLPDSAPSISVPFSGAWRRAAFSLIEVTTAIAIVAFALISIIGLLPAGVSISTKASMNSACTEILDRVIGEARQTDFSRIVYPSAAQGAQPVTTGNSFHSPLIRYFNDQGVEIIPKSAGALSDEEKAKIIYHVSTRVMTNARVPSDKPGFVGQFLATLTVQIAHNPGNLPLSYGADNLIIPPPGMQVRTLSIQLSKND